MMKKLSAIFRPALHWVLALVLCTGICFAADGPMIAIVNAATPVASVSVGGATATDYDSFSKAVTAVVAAGADDVTMQLLTEWTIESRQQFRNGSEKIDRRITIDLNGNDITYTGSDNNGFEIINSGTILTITDNSDGDPGTVSSTSKPVLTSNTGGTIKIEGGSYSGKTLMSGTGKLEIHGGTFSGFTTVTSGSAGNVSITGGTFNFDPSTYLADGYVAEEKTENSITTWTVKQNTTNVASVTIGTGDPTGCTSFAAAVEAVNKIASTVTDDATITLLESTSVNTRAELTRTSGDVILDLNGKTLTNNGGNGIIETAAGVNLTIKGSSTDGTGTGTVTYSSGKYTYIVVAAKDSTITIDSGKFTGFKSLTPTSYSGTINVKGGTFTGLDTVAASYSGTLSITGGTFNVDPFYVASGYKATKNSDGTAWTVAARTDPIASVDNTEYISIDDALKAVLNKKDSAVTLQLRDDWNIPTRVELRDGENDNGRKITIDLNGHNITYNGNSAGFEIINSGTELTITNSNTDTIGSVTSTQKAIFYSNEGGKIFVNSGTFTGEIMSGSGTLSITGGTFSQNPAAYIDGDKYVIEYDTSDKTWEVLSKNNNVKAEVTWNPDTQNAYTVGYTTITGAKAAVQVAGTTPVVMKLLDDWPISKAQSFRNGEASGTITLDLNGYTVSVNSGSTPNSFEVIDAGTTLTITDSSENHTGKIEMGSCTLFGADAGATVVVNAGTFTCGSLIGKTGTLSITGGTFSQDPSFYVAENYTVQENKGDTTTYTVLPTVATVTVGTTTTTHATLADALSTADKATEATITLLNDATLDNQFTFKAPASGTKTINLAMNGKTLTYSGTESTDSSILVIPASTTLNISGTGTVTSTNANYYFSTAAGSTLNIAGGTFTGATTGIVNQTAGSTVSITGGTFNFDPAQYVANGYVIAYTAGADTDATWTVYAKGEDHSAVAEVTWNPEGSEEYTAKYTALYTDMEGARIAVLGSGTTPVVMKLLDDWKISDRQVFRIGTNATDDTAFNITLDLNGKSISLAASVKKNTNGFEIINTNTKLTITDTTESADGTINMGSYTLFGANSGGTIIVEKGNFTGGTFLSGSGTLSINGGTFNYNPAQYVDTDHVIDYTAAVGSGETTSPATWTVYAKDENHKAVAEVNVGDSYTAGYTDIGGAMAAVLEAKDTAVTLKLLTDLSIEETQLSFSSGSEDAIARVITLDLNGQKIEAETGTNGFAAINSATQLTITDTTEDKEGCVKVETDGEDYLFSSGTTGKIFINAGHYTCEGFGASSDQLEITGGTFNVDPGTYIPEESGCEKVQNSTSPTTWTVSNWIVSVVYINSDSKEIVRNKYTTLPDAFKNAQDGDIIKILKNCTTSQVTLDTNRNLTLNLNDFEVSGNNTNRIILISAGQLTITGGENKSGKLIAGKAENGGAILITGNTTEGEPSVTTYGSVILQSGTIEKCTASSTKLGGGAVYVDTDCSFTMNGGTIGNCRAEGTKSNGGCVYIQGTFTWEDGTLCDRTDTEDVDLKASKCGEGGTLLYVGSKGTLDYNKGTNIVFTGTGNDAQAKINGIVEVEPSFAQVALDSSLILTIKVPAPILKGDTWTTTFSLRPYDEFNQSTTCEINDVTDYKDKLLEFTYDHIYPQNMADTISFTITRTKAEGTEDDAKEACKDTYSVKTYMEGLYEKFGDNEALIKLCADTLVYGAQAQLYMNHNTDSLATNGISWITANTISDHFTKPDSTVTKEKLSNGTSVVTGSGLILGSTNELYFNFTADESDIVKVYKGSVDRTEFASATAIYTYAKTASDRILAWENNNSTSSPYRITVPDLTAQDGNQQYTVMILDSDGSTVKCRITYSPAAYVEAKYMITTDVNGTTLGAMVKAFWNYCVSATEYKTAYDAQTAQ